MTGYMKTFSALMAMTIIGCGVIRQRVLSVSRAIQSSPEITGQIVAVAPYLGCRRVKYEYSYADRLYQAQQAVLSGKRAESFESGQKVALIVNPGNPAQAFLAALYR